ncbi:MAG: wax ester/triacylglycerol synthase family O-acyltransferase [Deltaproteobacteria bacterium]|nr:wax ester/triacylglycerol synthase family O-acyltransferase [Deltaproteobacteria bacterium]MBW2360771.1 wax ester/triacylglycerol synthase family O-acyltransferase [Deltaproteobacteria bacterium]
MDPENYERLSAMDTSFLVLEKPGCPLHVSATILYESGGLATADGGVDIEAYRKATAAVLHRIPRYRQKLQWIPVVGHPVWVDDPDFNLDYHIRHTSLPRPGNLAQLKRLSARIMAQPLDLTKPLWEMWLVEGLEGDRFAVISKIHHCMIDGAAGQDLAQILHNTEPDQTTLGEPLPFEPRPAPTDAELMRDEAMRYASLPLRAFRNLTAALSEVDELQRSFGTRARTIVDMMRSMREVPAKTLLNEPVGPHRRFDWLDMPLADVKAARRALGCTINDLVLAIVSGAVREFLLGRGECLDAADFRIAAPVSIRSEDERGKLGNRVSQWFVRAPIDEADPLERLRHICALTEELKASKQALDADLIMAMAEWTPTVLLTLASRSASGSAPYNMMVTNVPGPQFPLYLLGAKMEALYSQVPIADCTALGVALVSYDGKLCWGFNADFEIVPDLDAFVRCIENAFAELVGAVAAREE